MADYSRIERPLDFDRLNPHLAVTLIVPLSIGLGANVVKRTGKPIIRILNDSINMLINEISMDGHLRHMVDLSILTYGTRGSHNIYQGFAPVGEIKPVDIVADHGSLFITKVIDMAIDNTRSRLKQYAVSGGVDVLKPLIILIADECQDIGDTFMSTAANTRQREIDGKLRTLCFCLDGCDPTPFKELAEYVIMLNDYAFHELFVWLGRVIQTLCNYGSMMPPLTAVNEEGCELFNRA